jgi:hypothetical protein
MRKLGKQPRNLSGKFDFTNTQNNIKIPIYKFSFGDDGNILVVIKEEERQEIQLRINTLLSSHELINLVSEFDQLKKNLDTNYIRNEFFSRIDKLYKTIYLEGESLNKKTKCNLCPLEPI